jgi:hypothetical protein
MVLDSIDGALRHNRYRRHATALPSLPLSRQQTTAWPHDVGVVKLAARSLSKLRPVNSASVAVCGNTALAHYPLFPVFAFVALFCRPHLREQLP